MTQEQRMIDAARACLGTPFHHQGRTPGIGLDCIGLIVVAMQAAGFVVRDRQDYGLRPDGHSLVQAIEGHGGARVPGITPGALLMFRYDQQPQHVALATGLDTMIHSFAPAGCVVETAIGPYWRRRLMGVYEMSAIPLPSREGLGVGENGRGEIHKFESLCQEELPPPPAFAGAGSNPPREGEETPPCKMRVCDQNKDK